MRVQKTLAGKVAPAVKRAQTVQAVKEVRKKNINTICLNFGLTNQKKGFSNITAWLKGPVSRDFLPLVFSPIDYL
jgi:hypothetical protein